MKAKESQILVDSLFKMLKAEIYGKHIYMKNLLGSLLEVKEHSGWHACVCVCVCASLAWVSDNSTIEYSIFVILAVYMYANENIEGKLGMELIGGKWVSLHFLSSTWAQEMYGPCLGWLVPTCIATSNALWDTFFELEIETNIIGTIWPSLLKIFLGGAKIFMNQFLWATYFM